MKEHPIIFSTEMVKAILEGRKTQTRRVIKNKTFQLWVDSGFTDKYIKSPDNGWHTECPYGQPGDRLWVRETWRPSQAEGAVWFKAGEWDYTKSRLMTAHLSHYGLDGKNKWKPSIHMPKKYARIWLEIRKIRVERLQEIIPDEINLRHFSAGSFHVFF